MDGVLTATQLDAANAITIQLLKLSTSPPPSDIPSDDILRDPQDLAVTNCFINILDENFDDKMWNPHQKRFIFRQVVVDSVAHARYKNVLKKYLLVERELTCTGKEATDDGTWSMN
jgi:hypothetical protein